MEGSYELIGKFIGVRKIGVQTWVAFNKEYGVEGFKEKDSYSYKLIKDHLKSQLHFYMTNNLIQLTGVLVD